MGMLFISSLFASAYIILQLYYVWYWLKTPEIKVPSEFIPSLKITVVVVAHNEEEYIESCIEGILKQDYPAELFEIIVIDDRSSDGTVERIEKLQSPIVRIYRLIDYPEFIHSPAYKKSAIELAVKKAGHDWIVVTDADCIHPAEWLRNISFALSNTDAVFLAVPISYASGTSLLEKMQEMEMSVLMLITAAGIRSGLHDMANGANMSFSKKAFNDVHGYDGNYQYASGDDMFLIEKMRSAFPDRIAFVKSREAIVETKPHKDWTSLIKQRLRWAGKNKGLQSPVIRMIWVFVGLYHLMIFLNIILAIFHLTSWWPLFIMLLLKWVGDIAILIQATRFFKNRQILYYFIPLQMMYGVYILGLGYFIAIRKKGDW